MRISAGKSISTLSMILTGLFLAGAVPAQSGGLGFDVLNSEISRLSQAARGTVGVGALHLESGRAFYQNADDAFPMASTYKVPIAYQLLHRVDAGEISLSEMVKLDSWDLHPGSGTLTRLFDDPGVVLSLHNLLELMLLISDNSATDLVLEAAGGGSAVTARMKALGLGGIRVDRPTLKLIADWIGIEKMPPEQEWSPETFRKLVSDLSEEERNKAASRFEQDERDTSTPRDMTGLLAKIWKKEGLSDKSAALLLDIMERCETGENRIPGMLPGDTKVAHKTGTIGGTTNDVGIVTLPHGRGHLALSLFVKESEVPVSEREKVIAQIARALYDYFLFAGAD